MKTERFSPERSQWVKAAALLARAIEIDPASPRTRYFQALLLRGAGKPRESADLLTALSREFPRDREVQRQLGQTLLTLGRLTDARAAFTAILRIDPTDAGAYQFLSPLYASEGLKSDAARALAQYFRWRDDPLAQSVVIRFFADNPSWAEERVGLHVHDGSSSDRPILAGKFAAPDK
jgi:predicted Zn-dependent protease